jgi:hypothetical protein
MGKKKGVYYQSSSSSEVENDGRLSTSMLWSLVTCDDINIAPKAACERSALNNHGGCYLPTSE